MIAKRYFLMAMAFIFVPLIGCGSGGSSSSVPLEENQASFEFKIRSSRRSLSESDIHSYISGLPGSIDHTSITRNLRGDLERVYCIVDLPKEQMSEKQLRDASSKVLELFGEACDYELNIKLNQKVQNKPEEATPNQPPE